MTHTVEINLVYQFTWLVSWPIDMFILCWYGYCCIGDVLLFAVIMSRCVMPCSCMENMATIAVHSVSSRYVLMYSCDQSVCACLSVHRTALCLLESQPWVYCIVDNSAHMDYFNTEFDVYVCLVSVWFFLHCIHTVGSATGDHLARKELEWWGPGVVICLEQGANDLHMVHLMSLPPHHLCFSRIQNGMFFWYRLIRVVPDKGP